MSKLADVLKGVVQELDDLNAPDGFAKKSEDYLPNFVVTRAGVERHFTRTAQDGVRVLAQGLFESREHYRDAMRVMQFAQLIRTCIADLHADGLFAHTPVEGRQQLKLLEREVGERLQGIKLPFVHEFPATTLRLEATAPYRVGPAEIKSVSTWLETVTLSESGYKHHGIDPQSNWKSELLAILEGSKRDVRPVAPAHLQTFVEALQRCDAVVSVAVSGLEQTYSREVARMVARTALDGVNLLAGRGRHAFAQQALSDERLQPLRLHSIIVYEQKHWVGGAWSDRAMSVAQAGLQERVFRTGQRFASLCSVVACLLDRSCHPHPQLAMRWAAALEWYAEGCRETSTSVAVTKFAASLDVLTCGQKAPGIIRMLTNLLGRPANDPVFEGVPDSLAQIVQDIYGDGRSQLLHGNQIDRRVPFDAERGQAQALGALALVSLLERLATYQGPDTESAFLDMPPCPTKLSP
jgi:hypothetical protein